MNEFLFGNCCSIKDGQIFLKKLSVEPQGHTRCPHVRGLKPMIHLPRDCGYVWTQLLYEQHCSHTHLRPFVNLKEIRLDGVSALRPRKVLLNVEGC